MKKSRKVLSVILVLCIMAGFVPAAFAEDAQSSTEGELVCAPDDDGREQVSETYDSIELVNPEHPVLTVQATGNGNAEVKVSGDVAATTEYNSLSTVLTQLRDGGEAAVEVGGNVSAVSTDNSSDVYGVDTRVNNGGKSTITIHEDVSATGTMAKGVQVWVEAAGEAVITIDGSVTASAFGGDDPDEQSALGMGLAATAYNGEAKASASVGGNVTSTGGFSDGAILTAENGGQLELTVKGDLTGGSNGIIIQDNPAAPNHDNKINVVVEGTVKGGENCILLDEVTTTDGIEITVWKAEPAGGSIVAAATDDSAESADQDLQAKVEAAAALLEKSIHYIIKADKKANGGSFTLDGTTEISGFDTAKEKDVVTLKVTVQNGYRLLGAYNGTEPILKQDSAGNYYLEVPKGGGVDLTIKLEKVTAPQSSDTVNTGGSGAIGSRQLNGAWLYLYRDKTYLMVFGDGSNEKGTYAFRDGALVFTNRDGKTFEPVTNADGNFEYAYARRSGTDFSFTLSKTFTARAQHASEKV